MSSDIRALDIFRGHEQFFILLASKNIYTNDMDLELDKGYHT
jgi:hypothetical protein